MNNKNIIISILTFISLTIYSHKNYCQIFDNSQPHFKVKWNQINTAKYRLIFPSEFNKSAPLLASQLDQMLNLSSTTLQGTTQKINIILQQNHVSQNGFVQQAPRKSEFYSTPSGVADNQEWLPNLALHEMQHVAQFDKLTGRIKRPFGELLALAFFGINLPSWYYEGDATLHETLFSDGGRGRLSSWNMELRANILSEKKYNFNKYVHGSFKDIVPSYYTIGYFMNSEMLEKDPEINAKIYTQMSRKLLRPFNFQRELKRNYGTKASGIFNQTIQNLEEKWSKNSYNDLSKTITLKDKYPTDYNLPQVQNSTIYALQQSNQRTPRIVKIDSAPVQKVEEIVKTGAQLMPYFHIKEHLIVWDEYRKDARFSKQTYNVINVFDTKTHTKKTLTNNTRYYTPTLSHDLKIIACVEVNLNNESSIALLEIHNGNKIDSIPMPPGMHIQQPSFDAESHKIIAIGVTEKGTNLIEIKRVSKEITPLLDWTNLQFERPIYANNGIYFKVNQDGKDNIFKLEEGKISQITDSKFGAFNPFIAENKLWFNNFTTLGYQINTLDLLAITPKTIRLTKAETLYERQNKFKKEILPVNKIDYSTQIEPYNVLKNSINFHSLSLSANDFESFDNYKPGLYWLSNDILNTTQIKLGYERDVELNKNIFLGEITYQRYYPKFTLGYKNTGNYGIAKNSTGKDSLRFDFRNHQITADIQLPFSIYRGNNVYSYGFNFGTYYIKRYDVTVKNLKNFVDQIKFPLNYQVYWNKNAMRSTMDLAPKWGQNFSFIYRHMPFREGNNNSWALRTNFYFPGLALNHSFQTRFGIQQSRGVFQGTYDIPLIDGFSYLPNYLVKNTLLFDYRLPLAYPDLSIGQLAYIKRIHGQLSADYLNIHNFSLAPKSLSAGINFDFNLFKYNEPLFTFSISGTYLNDSSANNKLHPTFSLSYTY